MARLRWVWLCGWALCVSVVATAEPKAPLAVRCFEMGALYGQAYAGMDLARRAKGEILLNHCSMKKDPTLGRIPTDADVQAALSVIAGKARTMQDGAKINTNGLDQQMQQGRDAESNMLDQLLK